MGKKKFSSKEKEGCELSTSHEHGWEIFAIAWVLKQPSMITHHEFLFFLFWLITIAKIYFS